MNSPASCSAAFSSKVFMAMALSKECVLRNLHSRKAACAAKQEFRHA